MHTYKYINRKKPTNSYLCQESFVLFALFLTNSLEKKSCQTLIFLSLLFILNNSSSAFSLFFPDLGLTLSQNFLEINFNVL